MTGSEEKKRKPKSSSTDDKVAKINVNISPEQFHLLKASQSSVEIRRGPKGTAEITVKGYNDDLEKASVETLAVYKKLIAELDTE